MYYLVNKSLYPCIQTEMLRSRGGFGVSVGSKSKNSQAVNNTSITIDDSDDESQVQFKSVL